MSSRSPSRGRSHTRSKSPDRMDRSLSPEQPLPSSRRRSHSHSRSRTPTNSRSRSPVPRETRNGNGGRHRSRSTSHGQSPSRGGGSRAYRDRSHMRSPSHDRVQSSKIVVEQLTKNVTEAHLQEIFGSYGRIESIDMPLNRQCEFGDTNWMNRG